MNTNDPLDDLFITHDEALRYQLANVITSMPRELRLLFDGEFQRISPEQLSQLRADLAAAQQERDELKAKADVSICAWCGQESPKTSEAIASHVLICEKRPEKKMADEILTLWADLEISRTWSAIWKNGAYWFKDLLLVCEATRQADRDEANATIAQQAERIKALEQCQLDHENDCAVLPEDVSVTEYITVLQQRIAALEAAVNEARRIIGHTVYGHPLHKNSEGLQCGCIHCEEKRTWLSAHPAPDAAQQVTQHFDSARAYREALEKIEATWINESVADEHIAALKMYAIVARALNNADDEKLYCEQVTP